MFRRSFCFGKSPRPKTTGAAGRGPPGAFALSPEVPKVRAAELASLKQSSPPHRVRDWGAATPAGALRWRQKLARFFPSPSGPLLCSGRISCGLPSHGAFRCLAASSGGMRCRPYNCTTTLDSCFRRNDRKRNDRGAASPAGALEMAPWDGGGTKTKTVDCSKIQRDIFRLPCYCVRSGTQINEVYDG